jgi:glyoxylase-like metal-dependent hydrolase (beta-lactamase superfamily II)
MPDYGSARCDFPGGDAATLYNSVQKLYQLPDQTRMFLCHDYKAEGREDFVCETTVGVQKQQNIHLKRGITEQEFVRMRTSRDKTLSMPKLMLPSVQVNVRAGKFPVAEDNGTVYLKLPVDLFRRV